MTPTIVYILMISAFHGPVIIDGFTSKANCEAAYQLLVTEDEKTITGTGWNKSGTEFHIKYTDHRCVGVIK